MGLWFIGLKTEQRLTQNLGSGVFYEKLCNILSNVFHMLVILPRGHLNNQNYESAFSSGFLKKLLWTSGKKSSRYHMMIPLQHHSSAFTAGLPPQ